MVVLYSRRRVGKTTLIQEFAKDKLLVYFLATEESEQQNIRVMKDLTAGYTINAFLSEATVDNWEILIERFASSLCGQRLVLVIDEFQYLG